MLSLVQRTALTTSHRLATALALASPLRSITHRHSLHITPTLSQRWKMSSSATNGNAPKLYKSHQYLPDDLKKRSVQALQPRLAEAIDLRYQIKTAHWNVKGPSFIALHELFDKIAEESDEYIDNIAERIAQLGGIAEGTLRVAAKRTSLQDYPLNISNGADHVEALANALSQFGKLIRETSAEIESYGDKGTTDVLDDIGDDLDKWLWFVESHTQAEK